VLLATLARAAADVWAGQPLASMLEALRRAGVELAYSNELVPPRLRIATEPAGNTLRERTESALAAFQLRLHEVAPNRYVVDSDTRGTTSTPPADAAAPGGEGVTPTAPLDEVLVYAHRESMGLEALSLHGRQISRTPGATDDALGALRQLPGIAADTSARPYVRGSSQEDVLFIFDHVPLPDPFHLKNFGMLAGVFDISVVDRIDLYSGGFSARFGTRSGGVVELTPHVAESRRELLLGAGLSALRATGAGHSAGGVDWLASFRHSLDGTRSLSAGDPVSQPVTLDGLARLHWRGRGGRTWTVGLLGLDDTMQLRSPSGAERVAAVHRSQNLWLTTETGSPYGWSTRSTLIGSHARSGRGGDTLRVGLLSGTLADQRDLNGVALQHEAIFAGARERWDLGAEASTNSGHARYQRTMSYDPRAVTLLALERLPDADVSASLRAVSYAAFASYARDFGRHFATELGIRYDGQRYPGLAPFEEWSPRLNLHLQFGRGWSIYGSMGKYTQAQRPDERRFEESQYTPDHPQVQWQETLGSEFHPADGPTWRLEVYHKHWDRISPYFDNLINERGLLPELAPLRVRIAPRSADAQGAEISVRSATGRPWQYWASFSSAQVQDRLEQGSVSRSWDQRSALSSGVDVSHRAFSGTAVLRWHSGTPRTSISMTPSPVGGDPQVQIGVRNAGRGSDFVSLDLRAAWTHSLGVSDVELWTEVINALNGGDSCCAAPGVPSLTTGYGSGTRRTVNAGVLWRFH
jgi:hypothetical protein